MLSVRSKARTLKSKTLQSAVALKALKIGKAMELDEEVMSLSDETPVLDWLLQNKHVTPEQVEAIQRYRGDRFPGDQFSELTKRARRAITDQNSSITRLNELVQRGTS